MVEDHVALASSATRALMEAASSANRWAAARQALNLRLAYGSSDEVEEMLQRPRLRDELDLIMDALGASAEALDQPSRAYVFKRWQRQLVRLLAEDPRIADDLRIVISTMQQAGREAHGGHWSDDLPLQKRHSLGSMLQIGVSAEASGLSMAPATTELPYQDTFRRAPHSVLLANMRMEATGARSLLSLSPSRLGFPPIDWQPSALYKLIDPPFELLPNELFDRSDILASLEELLLKPDGRVHVLTGRLGVGKSAIALALAKRARMQGLEVWWVHGTAELIDACMIAVAAHLNADPTELALARAGKRSLPDVVWSRLEQAKKPWLLVFDDIDESPTMRESLQSHGSGWVRPSSTGLVLMTGRSMEAPHHLRHTVSHIIPPLGQRASARLMREFGATIEGADSEVEWSSIKSLSGIPLALKLKAGFSRAVSGYQRTREADQSIHRPTHRSSRIHENDPVGRLLGDIFASLTNPDVRLLLGVFAYYASDVPFSLAALDGDILSSCGVVANPETVRPAVHQLLDIGLIERWVGVNAGDFVRVHPMIASTWRSIIELDSDSIAKVSSAAAGVMKSAVEKHIQDDRLDFAQWHILIPHVGTLITDFPHNAPVAAIECAISVARTTMNYLVRTGANKAATRLGYVTMSLARELPETNSIYLDMEYEFAKVLMARGRPGGAHRLLRHVAETRRSRWGDHDGVALDAQELTALLLHSQGKTSQAEELLQRVLKAHSGTDELAAMRVLSHLTPILREQGRLGETERAARQVVETFLQARGPRDPETLNAEVALALTLKDVGWLDKAEATLRRVLRIRQESGGSTDPETIGTFAVLAETLRDLGRLKESETLLREVLRVRQESRGPTDPDTIDTLASLSVTLRDRGQLEEAESTIRQVFEVRRRLWGPDHPDTLKARLGLAVVLNDMGRLGDAEAILRQVISASESITGPDSPIHLSARHNLAAVLQNKGYLEESEATGRAVLAIREWLLGANHLETLSTMANLGSLLRLKGLLPEAEHVLGQVRVAYVEILGENHPHVLTVANNIANVLYDSGRQAEAISIYREVLAEQQFKLGSFHQDTLITWTNLAVALAGEGDSESAENLLVDVIDCYETSFDLRHPNLLAARYHLARVWEDGNRSDAALSGYRDVVELQRQTLGEGHSDTISTRLGISRVLESLGRPSESQVEYLRAIRLAAAGAAPGRRLDRP